MNIKWIKDSERLPTKRDYYFVKYGSVIAIAMFDGKDFFDIDSNHYLGTQSVKWLDESPTSTDTGHERELFIEDLKGFDFYILNYREHKSIAINFADDNQYKGYTFYKTNLGWSINPTKMGNGYVTNMGDELDFTKSFAVAVDVADQTK